MEGGREEGGGKKGGREEFVRWPLTKYNSTIVKLRFHICFDYSQELIKTLSFP